MSKIIKFPIQKSMKEVITENRTKRIAETEQLEKEIEEIKCRIGSRKSITPTDKDS
ncbi:hypothetical protein [Paenibacillus cremeus]|uniref:hypothetical protein n=1 Tax=Paenibacillus cremeus TaxID=2163881 RepID=UPI001645D31F|nr:hypothetical protein [Paenibacillus cremeus]